MNLIISPHVDDEVLGCGGFLAKNKNCFVYYCGIDESHFKKDSTSSKIRLDEIKETAKFLNFKFDYNKKTKVNHYTEQQLIPEFEDIINKLKPEMVLIPHPSYNQDHKTVHNAALVALRPHDKNFFVKKVLVYEQPHAIIWDQCPLNPNFFIEIDINKKIEAYKLQGSQVREMRSPELIEAIAKVRGTHINTNFAEAFRILRWTD